MLKKNGREPKKAKHKHHHESLKDKIIKKFRYAKMIFTFMSGPQMKSDNDLKLKVYEQEQK